MSAGLSTSQRRWSPTAPSITWATARARAKGALLTDCEPMVDDLHEFERRPREEHPDLPVVLIGHSMGGLIAARYRQRYTDWLAAAVLSRPLVEAKAPAQLFDPSASPWPRSTAAPPVRTRLHLTRPATA